MVYLKLQQGGAYIFQIMDFYSASGMCLLWVCFFQTIAISWVFGAEKFAKCIKEMTGSTPRWFWIISWKYLAPSVMLVRTERSQSILPVIIIIFSLVSVSKIFNLCRQRTLSLFYIFFRECSCSTASSTSLSLTPIHITILGGENLLGCLSVFRQ